jgi:hypothetical protein
MAGIHTNKRALRNTFNSADATVMAKPQSGIQQVDVLACEVIEHHFGG